MLNITTDAIWQWWADVSMPFLKALARGILDFFSHWIGVYWKIALMMWGLGVVVMKFITWAVGDVLTRLETLDTMELPTIGYDLLHYYQFINRFLPLSETLVSWGFCMVLWFAVTLLRWTKSFIPTLSN